MGPECPPCSPPPPPTCSATCKRNIKNNVCKPECEVPECPPCSPPLEPPGGYLPPPALPQGGGRGHAAQTVAPLQTGCKICLAGTSLLESRRMRGWRNSPGRRAGDRPTLPPSRESQRTGTLSLLPG